MTAGRGPDAVIDAVGMESEGGFFAEAAQFLKIKPDRTAPSTTRSRASAEAERCEPVGGQTVPDRASWGNEDEDRRRRQEKRWR